MPPRAIRRRLALAAVCTVAVVVAGCSVDGTPRAARESAGPGSTTLRAIAPTALILDASDSMLTADAPGRRIDAAKSAATGLVDAIPDGSRLAVLTYGTGTGNSPREYAAGCRDFSTLVPLGTVNKSAAKSAINSVEPRGFTPIAASLSAAAATLPTTGASAIVLISDGEDTCGRPPCDVAKEIKRTHPELQISTVGFKTEGAASEQLKCIADATGGMFVGAANGAQLAARLLATQDTAAAEKLSGSTFAGISLGASLGDIRKAHNDFPASGRKSGDQTIIEWRDCEWVFGAGLELDEIRPTSGTTTIDGIGVGSTVADAMKFYGTPTSESTNSDGTRTLVFDAGSSDGTGYSTIVSGSSDSARITRIVLCRCAGGPAALPATPPAGSCTGRVVGQTDLKHPHLGPTRIFLVNPGGDNLGNAGCVVAVTATGRCPRSTSRSTAMRSPFPRPRPTPPATPSSSTTRAGTTACWC